MHGVWLCPSAEGPARFQHRYINKLHRVLQNNQADNVHDDAHQEEGPEQGRQGACHGEDHLPNTAEEPEGLERLYDEIASHFTCRMYVQCSTSVTEDYIMM